MIKNKTTHEDNIEGNKEFVTSEKLSNEITHKDNIESNKDQIRKEKEEKIIQKVKEVSSSIVAPFKEYAHNEIEDSKEYIKKEIADGKKYFLSEIQKFNNDDTSVDERYLNYLETKDSDQEWVLTENGYQLKHPKEGFLYWSKDIGLGTARGVVKLTEGVGGLALGTLEKLNLISDGSVENFATFYQENIYAKMGDTETWAGAMSEGLSQFIIPGVGAYGIFAKLIKAKGVWAFMTRALSAEATTVAIAQVPGDPNVASMIAQLFNIDTAKADNIAKEFYNYLATPDVEYGDTYNADDVFAEKIRAIIGDMPLGPIGEGIIPLFKMFAKGMRKLKGNNEMINEIDKNIVKASDQEVFTVKQEFEKFQSSERVVSGKENIMAAIKREIDNPSGAGGFTMTLDGKDIFKDLKVNSGYMVAPLKETELKIKVQGEFTMKDLELLDQNMFALEKTLKENNVDYGEVYFGAYKSGDFYVFEPSVKIDNLDQALYIGMAGKQETIFDLAAGAKGDFDNAFIQTTKDGKEVGYGKIKDKSVFDQKRSEQGTTTSNLQEGFISTRSKVQAGGSKSSSITKTENLTPPHKAVEEVSPDDEIYNLKNTKPNKEFNQIINGKKPHQSLIVFKPNTPNKIKTEYYKLTSSPDGKMTIDENIRGSEIYNKYVDVNKSDTKLKQFIKYVGNNYMEHDFEKIMKKAGIDKDAYE